MDNGQYSERFIVNCHCRLTIDFTRFVSGKTSSRSKNIGVVVRVEFRSVEIRDVKIAMTERAFLVAAFVCVPEC
jgi:hypothetical protein